MTAAALDLRVDDLARVCYEAERAYRQTIGDQSDPSWDWISESQREAVRGRVWFYLKNPTATVATSHKLWLEEKEQAGWTYGPLKDPEKKEHPAIVPFDRLRSGRRSSEWLVQNLIFLAIVRSFVDGCRVLAEYPFGAR